MLLNNMIFIFDLMKELKINNILILLLLKWKQLIKIQKKLLLNKLKKQL